jgi:hypothetical protein
MFVYAVTSSVRNSAGIANNHLIAVLLHEAEQDMAALYAEFWQTVWPDIYPGAHYPARPDFDFVAWLKQRGFTEAPGGELWTDWDECRYTPREL